MPLAAAKAAYALITSALAPSSIVHASRDPSPGSESIVPYGAGTRSITAAGGGAGGGSGASTCTGAGGEAGRGRTGDAGAPPPLCACSELCAGATQPASVPT